MAFALFDLAGPAMLKPLSRQKARHKGVAGTVPPDMAGTGRADKPR
jgi:hypothetical protein